APQTTPPTSAPRPHDPFEAGAVLDERYALEALIAEGGTARVFRAQDAHLGRAVAVKAPQRPGGASAARLRLEGERLARLSHPALVRCFDAGEVGDVPYLVLEHIDGVDLAQVAGLAGFEDTAHGIGLALQVCRGLGYLHRHGFAHGDLKPRNILVTAANR